MAIYWYIVKTLAAAMVMTVPLMFFVKWAIDLKSWVGNLLIVVVLLFVLPAGAILIDKLVTWSNHHGG